MIPAGYMFKPLSTAVEKASVANVVDFFSAGTCGADISPFFTDYIRHWEHNGYWFFNSPDTMKEIARLDDIDLSGMTLFFYEIYELECESLQGQMGENEPEWNSFQCERHSLLTF